MRRSRVLLLLLLIPLLLFAARVVVQDEWYFVHRFMFSTDGQQLWTVHRRPGFSGPNTVRRWDLVSRRLLRQRKAEFDAIILSPDGRRLALHTPDERIELWDAATLQTVAKLPAPGRPVAYLDDHLVLLDFEPPHAVVLMDPATGKAVHRLTPPTAGLVPYVTSSPTGRFIAVGFSAQGGLVQQEPTLVYELRGGELKQLTHWKPKRGRFLGRTVFSPDGRLAAFAESSPQQRQADVSVYDLQRNAYRWQVTAGENVHLRFAADSRHLLSASSNGELAYLDVNDGRQVKRIQLSQPIWLDSLSRIPSNHLWVKNDPAALPTRLVNQPLTIISLRTGQRVMQLPMNETTFITLLATVVVLVSIWSLAWIVQQRRPPRWNPLLEAGVVHALLMFLLLLRGLTTESQQDLVRPVAWLLFGQIAALTCLAVAWTIFARQRWLLRVAACALFLGLAAAGLMGAWAGGDFLIWQVVVGATSLVTSLTAGLLLLRRFGWSIVTTEDPSLHPSDHSGTQYPLRDLMILAAGIGVFFSAARFFIPSAMPLWMWFYVTVEGVTYAFVAGVALWAVLAQRHRWLRWSVLLIIAPLAFALPYFPFRQHGLLPWWWYFATHGLAALHVIWTLYVFRMHGYRMERTITGAKPTLTPRASYETGPAFTRP